MVTAYQIVIGERHSKVWRNIKWRRYTRIIIKMNTTETAASTYFTLEA